MVQRSSIALLLGSALLLPALEQPASARSVSASSGAVFPDEEGDLEDCLRLNINTGAMISGCTTVVSVPLPIDGSGSKTVTFTGRNPGPFSLPDLFNMAECFAFGSDRFGTAISVSPGVPVP